MRLGGGGRYDGLVKLLGGEDTPAVGFAIGMDRVVLEMKKMGAKTYQRAESPGVFGAAGKFCEKKKPSNV